MSLKRLRRSVFATLLGLLALVGNGAALTQLNGNVVWAALDAVPSAAHDMDMAHGAHHMAQSAHGESHPCPEGPSSSGHTNRGHADCALCGPIGALAAMTLADAPSTLGPLTPSDALITAVPATQTARHQPLSYHSRAPPALS